MSFYSSKEELVAVLGAKTFGTNKGFPCQGVEYDSRAIRGGELFVALKGENSHGHSFLNEVSKRGAALFLVEDASLLETFEEKERLLVVDDTLAALWTLATHWRRKLNLPTIAVTGSVGKTTTKEMLASILLQKGPGNYALKSFNNHVGVPYTLLRSSPQHLWCVVEIGMNHPGEIAKLSTITEPDVSVITEVSPAHIGAFDGIERIAKEKLSIISGLKQGKALVVNGDIPMLHDLMQQQGIQNKFKVITAGRGDANDYKVSKTSTTEDFGISFHIEGEGLSLDATMQIPGRHNAMNAVVASAAARALFPDLSPEELKKGFEQFRAPLMRLNLKTMPDGRLVLDDSYNANPSSMEALLEIAADVKGAGKKIGLILGDMLELGDLSEKYHRELGKQVGKLAPNFVFAVGAMAPIVIKQAAESGIKAAICDSPQDAAKMAKEADFQVLFVKGSRGITLDLAVKALLKNADD